MSNMDSDNESTDLPMCENCEDQLAEWFCLDCDTFFCKECGNVLHKSAKRRSHKLESIGNGGRGSEAGDEDHTHDASPIVRQASKEQLKELLRRRSQEKGLTITVNEAEGLDDETDTDGVAQAPAPPASSDSLSPMDDFVMEVSVPVQKPSYAAPETTASQPPQQQDPPAEAAPAPATEQPAPAPATPVEAPATPATPATPAAAVAPLASEVPSTPKSPSTPSSLQQPRQEMQRTSTNSSQQAASSPTQGKPQVQPSSGSTSSRTTSRPASYLLAQPGLHRTMTNEEDGGEECKVAPIASLMDWRVSEVCAWLAAQGQPLAQYKPAFEKHMIRGRTLVKLNDKRLNTAGIKEADHRIMLLAAITKLRLERQLLSIDKLLAGNGKGRPVSTISNRSCVTTL